MTPKEAVDRVVRTGVDRHERSKLRSLFDAVVATAKEDECRRCAGRVREYCHDKTRRRGTYRARDIANDILVTGGLEPEE